MCRYLQWLIEDQDCDDTQFHTLYALSLARTAIETIETGLNYENYDARNQEESNISNTELGKNYGYSVRDRLQLFLQASDLYDPEEVLGVIEDSELWLEKVNLLFNCFFFGADVKFNVYMARKSSFTFNCFFYLEVLSN